MECEVIFTEKSITVTVGWCLFPGCLFSGRMQGPFRAWTFCASSTNPRQPPSPTVWTRKRCLGLLQHQGGDLSFNGWRSDHLLMMMMMMMTFITCHRRRTSWSTTSEASVASVIGRVTLRVTVLETQKEGCLECHKEHCFFYIPNYSNMYFKVYHD